MNLLSYDSKFSQVIRLGWKMVLLSLLWVILSLPVFTVGIATTALYYTIIQNVTREKYNMFQVFFHAVKENFKKSLLSGALLAGLALLFAMEFRYCRALLRQGEAIGQMYLVFGVFFALSLLLAVYTFSYQARFQVGVGAAFHDALLLMLSHFGTTLCIAAYLLIAVLAVLTFPVTILASPMICMWMISRKLEKLFFRVMREEDRNREQAQWGNEGISRQTQDPADGT